MKVMADHEKDLLEIVFRVWRSAVASTRSTRIDRPRPIRVLQVDV